MFEQKISTKAINKINCLQDDILYSHFLFPSHQTSLYHFYSFKVMDSTLVFFPDLEFIETKWKDRENFSHFRKFVYSILRLDVGILSINTYTLHIDHYSSRHHDLAVGNWERITHDLLPSILSYTTFVLKLVPSIWIRIFILM